MVLVLLLTGVILGILGHRWYLKSQNTFDSADAICYTEAIAEVEEKWLNDQLGPYCYACRRPYRDSSVQNVSGNRNPINSETN